MAKHHVYAAMVVGGGLGWRVQLTRLGRRLGPRHIFPVTYSVSVSGRRSPSLVASTM